MIVNAGKQYILDKIFNRYDWNADSSGVLYMGIGTSTDTNAGVVGPTDTSGVSTSGAWSGPSNADWRLTNEVSGNQRAECEVVRAGRTVFVKATITDDNVDWAGYGVTDMDIYECGLFIYPDYDLPSRDPTDLNATDADRSGAMIARFVFYDVSGSEYIARPLNITQGGSRIIKLAIADFEG